MLLLSTVSFAQTAQEILQKSFEKCQAIKNGYYEMVKTQKWMTEKDTSRDKMICYFKKTKNDSVSSKIFYQKHFYNGNYVGDALYTGNELIFMYPKDSSAEINENSKWAANNDNYIRQQRLYTPFTNKSSGPMPHDSDFLDHDNVFEMMGKEKILGENCFHIKMKAKVKDDTTQAFQQMKTLRWENDFWVSENTFLPLKYTTECDVAMNNDTMHQYENFSITKFELDNLKDDKMFSLAAIPKFYKMKNYEPRKVELLTKSTPAPDFSLISVDDKKHSLAEYKGKLVLIDFFYKSCYPCMLAVPVLQKLSEKYKAQGLTVIGIDPYDKDPKELIPFLKKRNVGYTVLLSDAKTPEDYHVQGYPVLYMIDKNGKIIHGETGYSEALEGDLEKLIQENLK